MEIAELPAPGPISDYLSTVIADRPRRSQANPVTMKYLICTLGPRTDFVLGDLTFGTERDSRSVRVRRRQWLPGHHLHQTTFSYQMDPHSCQPWAWEIRSELLAPDSAVPVLSWTRTIAREQIVPSSPVEPVHTEHTMIMAWDSLPDAFALVRDGDTSCGICEVVSSTRDSVGCPAARIDLRRSLVFGTGIVPTYVWTADTEPLPLAICAGAELLLRAVQREEEDE